MTTTINTELAKIDLDYAVKVTIGDAVKAIGKTLVTPKGDFEITKLVVQQNRISLAKDGKEYTFELGIITANIIAGKMSVK